MMKALLFSGFFFQEGESSDLLDELCAAIDNIAEDDTATVLELVELQVLVGQPFNFLYYEGSLTTPPCTENVKWFISETIMSASGEQISKIAEVMGHNNRPAQPLYSRTLTSYLLNSSGTAVELMVALMLGCLIVAIIF